MVIAFILWWGHIHGYFAHELGRLCRKEANTILAEERMEKEEKETTSSPDIPMAQEAEGMKRPYESPQRAATTSSASNGSGEGPTRRVVKAQKSNEGEPVAKKLFEDEENVSEKQHAAANKPHWLICLEGVVESQTKTLKGEMVSQGVRITELEETVMKGQDETNKKFGTVNERIGEVAKKGGRSMANMEERLRKLEVGDRTTTAAEASSSGDRHNIAESAAQGWRQRQFILGG